MDNGGELAVEIMKPDIHRAHSRQLRHSNKRRQILEIRTFIIELSQVIMLGIVSLSNRFQRFHSSRF